MNRRRFLQTTALTAAGAAAAPGLTFSAPNPPALTFVLDPADSVASAPAVRWALQQLQEVLNAKGTATRIVASLPDAPAEGPCVVMAGSTAPVASAVLRARKLAAPAGPEALALAEGEAGGRRLLLACGSDARGLTYALLELADRVRHGAVLAVPQPIVEQPANPVRSIYRCFVSEIEDKPWFYDRALWKEYLTMLAAQRFNRFSLAFGMGYNTPRHIQDSYLFFAYPFLLTVPGYEVRAGNLPEAERQRNLETLQFISEETAARGLHFQLGLWSHGRTWPDSAEVNYPLLGLDAQNHAPYCRDALAALLRACPAIRGVTFRVHGESGVPEDEPGFWETLFAAFGQCGRKVEIDMHAKNVTQQMIDLAVATGMPVTLSPKYWGEHQGLGYIQTAIRTRELAKQPYEEQPAGVGLGSRSFTRYGYSDFFKDDRPYSVLHRVWPGTQRLLLSGDPALAAAYGRVSSFCGGLGFELLDPLTFKGRTGSGHPGSRCAYADRSLSPHWDWQKFLYTYRLWGRLAYNPQTAPEVWQRFLRVEFAGAAEAVEASLSSATQVLALVTTAHGRSADCFTYWPEMTPSLPIIALEGDASRQDTDTPATFGNVSPFDPQLFARADEYADALLADKPLHKYTPIEVAQRLEDLAASATGNLARAAAAVPDKTAPNFPRLSADVTIQASLARFFAAKMRSAVLWRLHEKTGDRPAGAEALAAYRQAREVWAQLAEGAKAVYVADISFGNNANIRGHWLDRLPALNADLARMEAKLAATPPGAAASGDAALLQRALQAALGHPQRRLVTCRHTPPATFKRGKELPLEVFAPAGTTQVSLYYRRVNQALRWQRLPMTAQGATHRAAIPATYTRTHFPLQYYFGLDLETGPALYPGLDEQFMNQPYYVVRLQRAAQAGGPAPSGASSL